MDFKINVKPRIKLRLKVDWSFNGKHYKAGDEFHVIGEDGMRGYDIEDAYGDSIYEIRMVMDKFEEIPT